MKITVVIFVFSVKKAYYVFLVKKYTIQTSKIWFDFYYNKIKFSTINHSVKTILK